MEEQFGENRRFIRCDQFAASRPYFLAQLSKVIGAGVENPEDLVSLRPFLSSKKMIIVLDNAESILDPRGTGAQEIRSVVDELCELETICLLITSNIATVPPRCERPQIPTLSMEAAWDIFHSIYSGNGPSSIINDLLQRLDFHPLSITLLANAASHNTWDYERLAKEWIIQRAQVLRMGSSASLAATIKLDLASPTFLSLGPDAPDLLGVVALFPQGIDEKSLDWLFPTIPSRRELFDAFCVLSLTYRSDGFLKMLAPLRDHLSPQDPQSSPLLRTTQDRYFARFPVNVDPEKLGFPEAQWIVLEDANVEYLINVFTSSNPNRGDIWDPCYRHYWRRPRKTIRGINVLGEDDSSNLKRKQLADAAEEVTSPAPDPTMEKDQEPLLCDLHRIFGKIHRFKGNKKKAIHHFEMSLRTASPFNTHDQLFWIHHYLVDLFRDEGKFETANSHIEQANSHAVDNSLSFPPRDSLPQEPRGDGEILSTLEVSIKTLDLAKNACAIPPARVAFGSASTALTTIRVCSPLLRRGKLLIHIVQYTMFSDQDYFELGLDCARASQALSRVLRGGQLDELGPPALGSIQDLAT